MTATAFAPNPVFRTSPLAQSLGAAAQSSPDPQMVHGANVESSGKRITVADAQRVALEAAEKAWKMSGAAIRAFVTMLMNLLRWMSRDQKPAPGNGTDGPSASKADSRAVDENSILDPKLDSIPAGFSGKAFAGAAAAAKATPASVAGSTPTGLRFQMPSATSVANETLPMDADVITGTVERVAESVPDLAKAEAGQLMRVAAASVLDEQAAKLIVLRAKASEIGESLNSAAAMLAKDSGWTVEQAIDRALADPEVGGDHGDAIRRLFREGAAVESESNECQASIENALKVAHGQGVDILALVDGTKVPQALPQWQVGFDLKKSVPGQPPAPTAAELQSFALVASSQDDVEGMAVVERKGDLLKSSLNLSTGTDEQEETERTSA